MKKILFILVLFNFVGIIINTRTFADYGLSNDNLEFDLWNLNSDDFDMWSEEELEDYIDENEMDTEDMDEENDYFWKEIPSVIKQDTEITMFDKIKSDITVIRWANLKIRPNVKIKDYKIIIDWWELETDANVDLNEIILKNAKKVRIWSNNEINKIEWSADNLIIGSNSKIKFLSVNVKKETILEPNVKINKIYLTTNNLKISSNIELGDGNVYVYGNLEGRANSSFNGKITTFSRFFLRANNDFKGRVCILNSAYLGANSKVVSYNFGWLMGNIDPILDVRITDDSINFKKIKKIAEEFDKSFNNNLKKIIFYSKKINFLNNKLKIYRISNDNKNYAKTIKFIKALKVKKENIKKKLYWYIDKVFYSLEKYIQNDKKTKNLFKTVKDMYKNAVKYEIFGLVKQICANSNIIWEANSIFVRNWKIMFDGLEFRRYKVINWDLENKIITILRKKNKDKLFELEYKINKLLPQIAKKKNEQIVNALIDLDNIIRDILFYYN